MFAFTWQIFGCMHDQNSHTLELWVIWGELRHETLLRHRKHEKKKKKDRNILCSGLIGEEATSDKRQHRPLS